MTSWLVLLIATVTWIAWVPTAAIQRAARGERGGVSVFPVFPILPLVAWGCAAAFHSMSFPLGATWVAIAHLALLLAMVVSFAKSVRIIRARRGRAQQTG